LNRRGEWCKHIKTAFVWAYRRDLLLFPLLLCAYAVRAYMIHLPGPYADELLVVLPAHQVLWGERPFVWHPLFILGRWWPLTISPYTGALPVYAQLLFSFLAGGAWFGFRYLDILYALAAICLTYYFTRDFLGRRAALLSTLLLTFMPSFVFYSRVGEHVLFMRVVWSSSLLFCFHRWWKTQRWGYFYAGCLTIGLGLSTRLEMVWWLVALPAYTVLAHRAVLREVWNRMKANVSRDLVGFGCFLLGGGLFLGYNIHSHGGTFAYILDNLSTTWAGRQNVAFIQNLWARVQDLWVLLRGSDGGDFGVHGFYFANELYPIVFGTALTLLVARVLLLRWRRNPDRQSEFLMITTGLMLALSTFTVSVLRPMHLLMLMPLPVLIIVRGLDLMRIRAAVVIALAVLVGGDLAVDVQYYRVLSETQGVGLYSAGAIKLVQYLREEGVRKVIACDWGLLRIVKFLSRGEIGGREIFGYELGYEGVPDSFYQRLRTALQDPENVYLFYAPQFEQFKRHEAFLRYLENQGLSYERVVLHDTNGPSYYVYRVVGGNAASPDRASHPTKAVPVSRGPVPGFVEAQCRSNVSERMDACAQLITTEACHA